MPVPFNPGSQREGRIQAFIALLVVIGLILFFLGDGP